MYSVCLLVLLNQSLELVLGCTHELINLLASLENLEGRHGTDSAGRSNSL